MEKRGQAAMEFLMTYGWAILAAVIAIGVLAYFGVFSPSRYVQEMCTISPPFGCNDDTTIISAADGIDLVIMNGGGYDYNLTSVAITNCGSNGTAMEIQPGQDLTVEIVCDPVLIQDSQYRGAVTVTYHKVGTPQRVLESSGNLVRKAVLA